MSKSIGILYICTGPYRLFWEDFYTTFEKNFLPDVNKHYFVFTDASEIYAQDKENVSITKIVNQPWPLITLLKFETFLKIENEISKCDYLFYANANVVCDDIVTSEEFLPREHEELSVTNASGYFEKSKLTFPYERSKKSLAYIPWNCGEYYVCGGMICGKSDAFIKMSKILKSNIEEDLKRNVIAKWHDESHINRYIINKKDIRVLHPMYCYPVGFKVSYPRKISGVSKEAKFDVRTFKGQYLRKSNPIRKLLGKVKRFLLLKERLMCMFDVVRRADVQELKDIEVK